MLVPQFPYEARSTFEVQLPPNVHFAQDPAASDVRNKFFVFTASSSFRGNRAKTVLYLKTLVPQIEPGDLPAFTAGLRAIDNVMRFTVIVPKSAIVAQGKADAAPADFEAMARRRLSDRIVKTTATIKSGALSGRDLAMAYCNISAADSDLGDNAAALASANEALKLQPNDPHFIRCRAEAYFEAGQFAASVADYTQAITLGDTTPDAFYRRGIANFYAGALQAAASDLTRGSSNGDTGAQRYDDLWLISTLQRLREPIPEAIAARAAAQPSGEWPLPALAMLVGRITPEEMLQQIDAKSGDDQRMARCEGYFFLGQHYLAAGDRDKARIWFERSRQQGVIFFTEHIAAGFELQKLAAAPKSP